MSLQNSVIKKLHFNLQIKLCCCTCVTNLINPKLVI